jgi:hypothetical protein
MGGWEKNRVDSITCHGAKTMNGVLNNAITDLGNAYPGMNLVTITDTGHGLLDDSIIMLPDIASYSGLRIISNVTANTFDILVNDAGGALANFTPAGTELWYVGQTYPAAWELIGYKIHLDTAGATTENLTIDVDAAAGSEFDWNILTQDMNGTKDIVEMYEETIPMKANDILKINYANTNNRTWGVEILSRLLA